MSVAMMLAAASAATPPIDYSVSIEARRSSPVVTIAMSFDGDTDGESAIDLPTHWAGSNMLWRDLGHPTVIGGRLLASSDPAVWRVAHAPGARVTVRYTIRDAQAGVPDAATFEKARPVVERDWLYLHGEGVFAIPTGRGDAPARFRWGKVAPRWKAASDLEHAPRLTANGVGGGVVIAGTALRITGRRVGTGRLRVAVLGKWSFADAMLVDRTARVMATENAMLGADAIDYFVPLAPLTGSATGAISYGGSGRTAGFALTSTDNVLLDDMTRLLSHEYGHRWFGKAFGTVADGAGPYWFTEGVNDWFAGRAMVRAGLWSNTRWAKALNALLLRYGSSSARALTDVDLTERFWTDPDAMQVQYDRGNLTALLLDRSLAERGGSMPILRWMAREPSREDEIVRFDRRIAAVNATALSQARREAASTLRQDALAPCGPIRDVTQAAYSRGFAISDDRIVTSATGPAEAAGVRAGMRLVRRIHSDPNDSTIPYEAEFDDQGTQRTLSWLPRGTTMVHVQQLVPTTIETPACTALVAGSGIRP